MRRLSVLAPLLGCLAFLASGCLKLDFFKRPERTVALTKGPQVGSPAPDIEGEDFAGQRFKLSDYRGNVVVVSFWATTCGPCRDLIPHERALVERYTGRKFVLLGVNFDSNPNGARKAMAAYGVTWRNWQAGGEGNPIQQRWPVEHIPTIYVIDANGIVRYAKVGGAHIENVIEPLLAEAEAKK